MIPFHTEDTFLVYFPFLSVWLYIVTLNMLLYLNDLGLRSEDIRRGTVLNNGLHGELYGDILYRGDDRIRRDRENNPNTRGWIKRKHKWKTEHGRDASAACIRVENYGMVQEETPWPSRWSGHNIGCIDSCGRMGHSGAYQFSASL
jgi:hypothetical protein